jgi:hypothetical protein
VLLAVLASLLLAAPTASASSTGRARGAVYGGNGVPTMVVRWFSYDWTYLGSRTISNGIYSLNLAPGTYRLQFVDQRPAYDLKKYAPADATITVRAGSTTTRNVRMHRGAALYGVARAGGKVARGARVVAANTFNQSYEVRANSKGQFAIGGLPSSRYSVFTYDRRKTYVGKSVWVGALKAGRAKKVNPRLAVRAGRLLVDLYAGSDPLRTATTVTIVSAASGQWWSARSYGGSVSFSGLYPGRYRITVPGTGVWFGRSGAVSGGVVRAGRVAFGSFRLTQRGGSISGRVVDDHDPATAAKPIARVKVSLRTSSGAELAETTTASNGRFTLSGRLATQSGLQIVLTPENGDDSWMQGQAWCLFSTSRRSPYSITIGKVKDVGDLSLPRSTSAEQPERCQALS